MQIKYRNFNFYYLIIGLFGKIACFLKKGFLQIGLPEATRKVNDTKVPSVNITFIPSTRCCTVRHSPSFASPQLSPCLRPGRPGVLQKNLYGDAQSRLQNLSLYLRKCDIITHHYTKLPQKHSICNKLALFWSNFPKFAQFAKLGEFWGLE